MKIITILGTRPEIIRLSRVIEKLDLNFDHKIIHTGQNFDKNLNDIFFEEMGVRKPDYQLEMRGSFGEQLSILSKDIENILMEESPKGVLILGDTNTGLASIITRRLGIPVYHMEAGNRCYNQSMAEEINRKVIDHSSTVLMPYTTNSKNNLIKEGITEENIIVIGNPIYEVMNHYQNNIDSSNILEKLNLEKKKYVIVTLHRQENVDDENVFRNLLDGLNSVQKTLDCNIIVSTHPRTRSKMKDIVNDNKRIRFLDPFGFFDFVKLEKDALCILTDSGTVQEEATILKVPNVILRNSTERPETVDCGSSIIAGTNPENILSSTTEAISRNGNWNPPEEYLVESVSDVVLKVLLNGKK